MQRKLSFLYHTLAVVALILGLYSCDTPNKATQVRDREAERRERELAREQEIRRQQMISEGLALGEQAGYELSKMLMAKLSPNTGEDPDVEVYREGMQIDPGTRVVGVPATLSWSAKPSQLSSNRARCEVSGVIYIRLNRVSNQKTYVQFEPSQYNKHYKDCYAKYKTADITEYISLKPQGYI